jgi:hypothetical protein
MFKKWTEREAIWIFYLWNENISCILSKWKYIWGLSIFYHVWMWLSRYLPESRLYGFSLIWTESSCAHLMLVWFLSYQRRVHFCSPEPLSSMVWQLVAWHCICFSISIVWLDLWWFDISWFTWFGHLVMSSEYLLLVCTWCLSFYFDNSSIRWLGGHMMLFQPIEYRLLDKIVECYPAVSMAECCWTLHRRIILPSKSDVNLFLYMFLSPV